MSRVRENEPVRQPDCAICKGARKVMTPELRCIACECACCNCGGSGYYEGVTCCICEGTGKEPVCQYCTLPLSLSEVEHSGRERERGQVAGEGLRCEACALQRLRGPVSARMYPPEAPTEPAITYFDDDEDDLSAATGGGR